MSAQTLKLDELLKKERQSVERYLFVQRRRRRLVCARLRAFLLLLLAFEQERHFGLDLK